MSPFKEPQPRKQPTDQANGWKAREAKKPRAAHPDDVLFPPPLEDLGEQPIPSFEEVFGGIGGTGGVWTLTDAEFKRELATASDAGRAEGRAEADKDFQRSLDASRADLEVRAIALEWAVAYWAKDGDAQRNSENVVFVADKFEKYLREGKQ